MAFRRIYYTVTAQGFKRSYKTEKKARFWAERLTKGYIIEKITAGPPPEYKRLKTERL